MLEWLCYLDVFHGQRQRGWGRARPRAHFLVHSSYVSAELVSLVSQQGCRFLHGGSGTDTALQKINSRDGAFELLLVDPFARGAEDHGRPVHSSRRKAEHRGG